MTAAQVPGAETEMLDLARKSGLGPVRNLGRKLRVAMIHPDELRGRQRAARSFKSWRDELGMVCGSFALTPEVGLALVNRIALETDRLLREARGSGDVIESRAMFAADALAAVLRGSDRTGVGAVVLNIVIDWAALVQGHVHAGERCHLVGGGPIPWSVVRELCANAFVKAVLTDGTRVQRVKHFGRRVPAELLTALELGPPPGFDGVTCGEEGCDRRYGLEWDHVVPVAGGGGTSFDNLRRLCGPHHDEKTSRDRADGWRGS